jgi:4-cresol dehydrogenase (hydroxylating)
MCKNDHDIEAIIDIMGPLRLQGVAQSATQVFNDLRAISGSTMYPWHLTDGKAPMSAEVRRTLQKQFGLASWIGTGAITGSPEMVDGIKKKIGRELKRIPGIQVLMLNDGKMRTLERVAGLAARLGNKDLVPRIASLKEGYQMLKGIPSTVAMPGSWWRTKKPTNAPTLEPLDHNSGMAWVSPVAPTVGKHVARCVDVMDAGFRKHGFDLLLSMTMITERSTYLIGNLTFDRSDAAETARARECYEETNATLKSEGYLPYRKGIDGFAKLAEGSSEYWGVVDRIKGAMDPNNILAPGRYQPSAAPGHP